MTENTIRELDEITSCELDEVAAILDKLADDLKPLHVSAQIRLCSRAVRRAFETIERAVGR